MKIPIVALATLGAVLGALGQVCFRHGAEGRDGLDEFINIWIFFGLLLYAAGTIAWIFALSRAPLTFVYPFTVLTYVLVNILGISLLGEKPSANLAIGAALVLLGLFVMTT